MRQILGFSSRYLSQLVFMAGLLVFLALYSVTVSAAGLEANGIKLKTQAASSRMLVPLRDAIYDFDDNVSRNGGKVPADSKERLAKMEAIAARAKGEIRSFTSRLRAADEIAAFDAYIEARAKKESSSGRLLAELRASGGAFAVLTMADVMIDDMIQDRRHAVEQAPLSMLYEFLGIKEARAAVGCALFWWVISAGTGTAHAYRSCYY